MSLENAFRFLMTKNKDEKTISSLDAIRSKYQGKHLSDDERDSILEEISQLAKKSGFDFTSEDLMELQKNAEGKLSDEELDPVTGGSTQFTHVEEKNGGVFKVTSRCQAQDEKGKFIQGYMLNICSNYVWNGSGSNDKKCACCANFYYDWEIQYLGAIND